MSYTAALHHIKAAQKKLSAGMYMSSYEASIVEDLERARAELGDVEYVCCDGCGDDVPAHDTTGGWCSECIEYDHAIMNGKL